MAVATLECRVIASRWKQFLRNCCRPRLLGYSACFCANNDIRYQWCIKKDQHWFWPTHWVVPFWFSETAFCLALSEIFTWLPWIWTRGSPQRGNTKLQLLLQQVIIDGWLSSKTIAPLAMRAYFDAQNELTVADSLGNPIVVSKGLRRQMLRKAHDGHMGMDGSLQWLRELLYWLRMTFGAKEYLGKSQWFRTLCRASLGKDWNETDICDISGGRCWSPSTTTATIAAVCNNS